MNYRSLAPDLHSDSVLQALGEGPMYDHSIVDLSRNAHTIPHTLRTVIATLPHWIYMAAGFFVGLMTGVVPVRREH